MKRIVFIFLSVVFLAAVGIYFYVSRTMERPVPSPSARIAVSPSATSAVVEENPLLPEDLDTILEGTDTVPLDTIPSSYTVIVNRNYPLSSEYAPTDLTEPNILFNFRYQDDKRKLRQTAARALENMFKAAQKKKIILCGISGYRSYQRQQEIYNRNVALRGQTDTDTVSAMPGTSEHQTGLTIDISAASVGYRLDQSFGDTREGRWVAENAHKYGYIVRYPYGKSEITGYHYEPWHIRYVGETIATYLYQNNLTLEEYYGVSCNKPEEDTGVDVEEPDEVKYATPKPTKKPTMTPKPTFSSIPTPTATPEKTKKPKTTKPPKTAKPKPTKKPTPTKKPKATVQPKATAQPADNPRPTPPLKTPVAKTPEPPPVETEPAPTPADHSENPEN